LEVLRQAGLDVKQELPYATNSFFVAAPEGTGQRVFDIANELLQREDVEYAHPGLVRRLGQRIIFPQQWHLKTTVVNDRSISASANVEAAHAFTQGGNVTIAIIDTGIDIDHGEFSSPGKIVAPETRPRTTPIRGRISTTRNTVRPVRVWPAPMEGSGHRRSASGQAHAHPYAVAAGVPGGSKRLLLGREERRRYHIL
jgi:subtilisin family serine protease